MDNTLAASSNPYKFRAVLFVLHLTSLLHNTHTYTNMHSFFYFNILTSMTNMYTICRCFLAYATAHHLVKLTLVRKYRLRSSILIFQWSIVHIHLGTCNYVRKCLLLLTNVFTKVHRNTLPNMRVREKWFTKSAAASALTSSSAASYSPFFGGCRFSCRSNKSCLYYAQWVTEIRQFCSFSWTSPVRFTTLHWT